MLQTALVVTILKKSYRLIEWRTFNRVHKPLNVQIMQTVILFLTSLKRILAANLDKNQSGETLNYK